jgi:hypothetical protein
MRLITPYAGIPLVAMGLTSARNRSESSAKASAAAGGDKSDVAVSTEAARIQPVARYLTLSSELVPCKEIDAYSRMAGYIKVMALPEVAALRARLDEDNAAIKAQEDQITRTLWMRLQKTGSPCDLPWRVN